MRDGAHHAALVGTGGGFAFEVALRVAQDLRARATAQPMHPTEPEDVMGEQNARTEPRAQRVRCYTHAMEIRVAEPGDLEAITDIYNRYVETSHVTFDVTRFSVEQRREWFAHHAPKGPHRLLVAVDSGVVAYASTGRWRPKPAYDTTVELSVYCAPEVARRGYGRLLCERVLEELASEDVARVVGGVALPNPASLGLLAKLGFRSVGVFTQVGRKFGRYWDVEWFEKAL